MSDRELATSEAFGSDGSLPEGKGVTRREVFALSAAAAASLVLPGGAEAAPPRSNGLKWFDQSNGMGAVRSGNLVIELIDGIETFTAMVAAIRSAGTGPGAANHFIYLIGWTVFDNFEMVIGDPGSTLQVLLVLAALRGVEIRALVWDQPLTLGPQNQQAVNFINSSAVPTGGAILDNRLVFFIPKLTSHHQKLLVINGPNGLFAFAGGLDINPDRIHTSFDGGPYHDVDIAVFGPSAHDLLQVFVERWTDNPAVASLPLNRQGLRGRSLPAPSPIKHAPALVQVGRTYANGASSGRFPPAAFAPLQPVYDALRAEVPILPPGQVNQGLPTGYSFAPFGSQQIARMLLKGISQAQKFIYIEDQYFVDSGPNDAGVSAREALIKALPRLQHLTVLCTHPDLLQLPQKRFRRHQLINALVAAGGSKVRVFTLTPPGAYHTYVHSKTWIFDDEYAVVGSCNFNRRSWTNDSEVSAGFFEPTSPSSLGAPQRLRMKLWAEHLNVDVSRVLNGVTSARLWLNPPPGARVARYIPSTMPDEINHSDLEWFLVDPDGSGNGLGPFSPF